MNSSIPNNVKEDLAVLNNQLTELENVVDLFITNRPQYESLSLLERARFELASLFSINSLYWVLLRCKGLDPKEDSDLSAELKRIKEYMGRMKKFEDASKRPKYENKTVKRFVKHALFDIKSSSERTSEQQLQTQIGEAEFESKSTNFSLGVDDDEIILDDDEVDELPCVAEDEDDELPTKVPKRA